MSISTMKDKLKQTAQTTANRAKTAAQKPAQTAKTNARAGTKSTDTRRNGKPAAQTAAKKVSQKAAKAVKTGSATLAKRVGKQAAKTAAGKPQMKKAAQTERAMQRTFDQTRFARDLVTRQNVRAENFAKTGTLVGKKIKNPVYNQMVADETLKLKLTGEHPDKPTYKEIIDSTALDPLSALKADSRSYANFDRNVGVTVKQKEQTDADRVKDAAARIKERTRQRGAKQQTLSRYDNALGQQYRDEIRLAKQDYDAAKRRGDTEGMEKAHRRAETWRRIRGGYSGGDKGNERNTPEVTQEDRASLTKEGLTRLRAAKLGYENAQTDEERARYAAQGEAIRRDPTLRKEGFDRGAYRETDSEGRMRYAGTTEERKREQDQAAAIPKAIGTGIAGSFLSIPGTTGRALQADAARSRDFLQALSDIRGGGEVNISEPEAVDPDSLAQRLLRQSQGYREQATEGQRGLERYLTEALITGGEMAPGLLASAATGGATLPGLAVMGAQAAGREMGTLEGQGVDPVQAFNRGVLSGAIEAGTELIPLRNLTRIARGGGDSFARNLLTQALEEVGTEEASELLGYGADRAFRDPNASLTAQDLLDTAVISALTSIGMGAGAGMIGARRSGRTGGQTEQADRTTAAMDRVTPTVDELAQREAAIQDQIEAWKNRATELLDRMTFTEQDPTWHKHLLGELAQHQAQGEQLRQQLVGLEMQKAQRTQVEQEKARQAQRQAEEAQRAEQERPEAQVVRDSDVSTLPPASPVPLPLARGGERIAQVPAQTPQETAQQPQTNPVQEQATESVQTEMPAEGQETARATSQQYGQPENHIDNRDAGALGDRKVKAFQWDHPEIKPFYQEAAQALKTEVEASLASRQTVRGSNKDRALGRKTGTLMARNEPLRKLHDLGLSSTDILKACDALISDHGQENVKAAKLVELALDDMLSNGYTPVEAGGNPDARIGANQDYIRTKEGIAGGVAQGSFEQVLRDNALPLELGEVTEEELRAEWEAGQNQEPEDYSSMEEELADLQDRMEILMEEAETDGFNQEFFNEQLARMLEEERAIRAKWANHARENESERSGAFDDEAEAADEQDPYSVGAAPSGFDPYSRMANEYGTIEPGENPARMVDVPVSTNGEDRVRRYIRTVMEAEVTPEEAVEAFEQDVANGLFSYHPRRDAEAMAAATNTIESRGYDGALAQWQDVVDGRRIAGKDDIVLAQMLYSLAAQNRDMDTARRLAAEIAAEGTAAGQKVQALRLLKKATPEGKLYYIRKTVDKLQTDLNEKRGDKAPDLEIDPDLEEALLDAETEEEQRDALDQIYDDVARQIPGTLGDRLNAWRYFAMLGNPRTHIRNVVGNIVVQAPLQVSNKASALVQAALPKEKRTRAVVASRAAKRFAREDYRQMMDVLSGDKYSSEETEIRRRQKLFPSPIQAAMDFNSKALEAEDMLFKRGTYIQSLASFITARGWDPANLTESQLEQARTHAVKDAKHATFQNESALASAIAKLENKNKVTKVAIGGLVPFKGVPINIAKMGFDLSPAGLAKAITYDAAQVKKGNMDATDMIDHLTRGLTGTSIAALGYFLTAQGWLTAGADDDDKENYFNMAQGSQEYALDLGDFSYTIDWAAPSAIPLFLGAEYFNARQKWGEESEDESKAFKDGLESLSRLFDPMLNMTVLSGVSDTLNTISYNQTNPLFPLAWGIAQNYAGQFVPTLSGQIARTVDDTRRTTYVDRERPIPNSIQRFIQRQENKIPGLSQRNLPYLDSWGRENRTESPLLRAFENFLSPGYAAKKNTTAVDAELARLNEAGFDGMLPVKAKTSTKVNDAYLSAQDYEALVKTQGKTSMDLLMDAVQSDAYQGMTDEAKAAYVKKIFDYAKTKGKQAAGEDPGKAPSWIAKLDQAAKDSGTGVSALLRASMQVEATGDADGNGSIKTEEAWKAIQGMDTSDNEKRALFDLYNGTKQSYDEYAETAKKAREKAEKEAAAAEKANTILGSSAAVDADTFHTEVEAIGGYNSMSYTNFFDTMDKLGIPEAERANYYEIVQSYKGHPWKKTYAQAKKYKGR